MGSGSDRGSVGSGGSGCAISSNLLRNWWSDSDDGAGSEGEQEGEREPVPSDKSCPEQQPPQRLCAKDGQDMGQGPGQGPAHARAVGVKVEPGLGMGCEERSGSEGHGLVQGEGQGQGHGHGEHVVVVKMEPEFEDAAEGASTDGKGGQTRPSEGQGQGHGCSPAGAVKMEPGEERAGQEPVRGHMHAGAAAVETEPPSGARSDQEAVSEAQGQGHVPGAGVAVKPEPVWLDLESVHSSDGLHVPCSGLDALLDGRGAGLPPQAARAAAAPEAAPGGGAMAGGGALGALGAPSDGRAAVGGGWPEGAEDEAMSEEQQRRFLEFALATAVPDEPQLDREAAPGNDGPRAAGPSPGGASAAGPGRLGKRQRRPGPGTRSAPPRRRRLLWRFLNLVDGAGGPCMPVRMDTTPIPCSNSVLQALAGTGDLYYRSAAWSREPERRDGFTPSAAPDPAPRASSSTAPRLPHHVRDGVERTRPARTHAPPPASGARHGLIFFVPHGYPFIVCEQTLPSGRHVGALYMFRVRPATPNAASAVLEEQLWDLGVFMQRTMMHKSDILVWCGVVWCGVVWCGVMWCGVVWCGVVWCGVVWYCVVLCGVVWCGVVWCGVVWCGVVWCGVVWCGVLWCGVVWCGVPKALLPKGKGRDVYPRVQGNGLGCVCCVRAVCKCVVA